ncbi:hypothetical protein RV10_GL003166 [Enterococcus pallens]|nr:hypothetical protein RV10_GL003166 [Enterococcus pallens]
MILLLMIFRKKSRNLAMCISLLLSILTISPILVTMNKIAIPYPANVNKTKPALTVAFPFEKDTIVGWGGNNMEENIPHAMWASERWAYDLVMEPYEVGTSELSDYGIYDQTVLSPVEGTVVAAKDSEQDIPAGTEEFITSEGNHVYLKVKETGTYILLNHLKKDSVLVNVGDEVTVGQKLGRIGNSGSTSEPHLHIHHQRQNPNDVPYPVLAEGLPLYFSIDGKSEMPVKRTKIEIPAP